MESGASNGGKPLIAIRHARAAGISMALLAALAAFTPLHLTSAAKAQSATAALLAKPLSMPDIVLGPANAPVTVVEYASMTCSHCAAFEQNVFPMLRSRYIDTGKVRFVFREFPLEIKAVAASMLARCIAGDDAVKYFETIDILFKQQDALIEQTIDTLKLVGKRAGMSEPAVEACVKDQALLDKIKDDQSFAFETLKVDATPTFFFNGERVKGAMSFEELEAKINSLLKR